MILLRGILVDFLKREISLANIWEEILFRKSC
jgi:hypothetical protein